jgi:redox-sensitive bicupin YhaK (pirin superfamily)
VSQRAAPAASVHRAADRFRTREDGRDSWHSFAFGAHHDPANTHHGRLIAHNDEYLAPGAGYASHAHREMEIVTWVLSGTLRHEDSTGRRGTIFPGLAQRMSAGTGIVHAESTGEGDGSSVRFVQMWVPPDVRGREPGYAQAQVDPDVLRSGLVPIASGLAKYRGRAAITLANAGAAMLATTLLVGAEVEVPDAPFVHLFVASGAVDVDGLGRLDAGDAVRFTSGGVGVKCRTIGMESSDLILWEMLDRVFG